MNYDAIDAGAKQVVESTGSGEHGKPVADEGLCYSGYRKKADEQM